jgi:gliding motility-associated-like protein
VKKLYKHIFLFAICLLLAINARSQSGNSNIGTEFWTAYMVHINGATGASASQMILYIASDVVTTGTVSITDNSFTAINFTVAPNVVTLVPIPSAAYLGNTNGSQSKGLHITSKNPIAVYAHIYASSVSGATLLLPVNTMANDYYSLNFTQLSNATPSYSSFMVIGTEDNTSVEITPSAALIDGSKANTKFTITLNKGQVYQGLSNTDLTGTHIASVSTGSGCKKIAVFSGSNKIYIGSPNSSSDNLFQQVYPTASWGKNYITVPLKTRNYDVFRIVLSDPATTVTLNGSVIPIASFTNSLYYQFNSQATNVISSDKPIQVIQYAVTQGNGILGTKSIAGDIGDPEMIYLNPLEQNIDHVTLYSTNKYLILNGFINVVIPTSAVSSFLLDGVAQTGSFYPVPGNTAYSYAQLPATVNATHNIAASQGFNAIAYGFGQTESYGYAAGTNVKNLNEYAQFTRPGTSSVASSGCTGSGFEPQVILPYVTSSITWDFGNGTTPVVQSSPSYISTIVKGTQTLYVYDYGQPVVFNAAGTYAVNVTVVDPITTVCGSNEVISLNYTVSNPPTSKFSSRDTVCIADTIGFKDLSTGTNGINGWHWNFGNSDTSNVQNPVYKFLSAGNYTVGLTVSSGTACPSVVYTKNVHVRPAPVAAFSFSTPDCETQSVTISDQSTTVEGKIVQWIWDYGDGSPIDTKTGATLFTHTYAAAGTYTIKLQIVTDKNCSSSTVSHTITVHPHPVVDFGLPDVCLANAIASFTDKSTISDNSSAQFKYLWNFGDVNATGTNPNTSILKNPTHQFTAGGNYTISLSVTSKDTCTTTLTKTFLVSGQANFLAVANSCPADSVLFTDKTNGATPATSSWHWDFGTGDTSNVQNPKYPFAAPGNYTVKLTVTGHNGCSVTSYNSPIHIYKKPVADFAFSTLDCETGQITLNDKSTATEGTLAQSVWDYGDGSATDTRTSGTAFTHVFAKAGTYVVKLYSITNLGCASPTVSKSILVHPKPVVDFGLPDVCLANAVATFTDKSTISDSSSAKFKYLWNFGDGYATVANPNTSIAKNPAHQYTKAGTYTISLSVTSKDTCTTTLTKTFLVSGQANFLAVANSCPADSVLFTDKTNGATPATSSWHWDFGTGDTSNVQNPKYPFAAPGNYTVKLTVTGHNGCSVTSYNSPIHIYKKPVADFAFSTLDCETGQITLNDKSTATEGTLAQSVWDYGDGSATDTRTSGTAFTHVFAKAGTYVVKLYSITNLGCASPTVSKSILVHPKPVVDFGLPDVCLANAVATFTDKSTISDSSSAKFKYLWNFGDGYATVANPNTSIAKNPAHQYTKAGTYTISLSVTSKDTCTATATKTFVISGQANFSAAANSCPLDSVQFTDKSDGATKASSSWHWVFGSTGDTSNVQNPKYAFKSPGNYAVTLTVTGHNGCSTTSYSAPIHIYTKPVAKFTYSAIDCETQSITFTDQSTSTEGTVNQWIWDYGDGSALDTRSSAAAFTHTFSKAGTYNVKLYTISSLGCMSLTVTKAIIVYPLPTKDFTIPDVCLNDTYAQFTAVSTIADNTTSTYSWDFGDGSRSTPANPNTATGLAVKHKYTATGNYNVHLTITSAHGCVVDTIKQFTVNGSSPQSKFVVLNSATLCSNREVFFIDSASVPGFGNGSVTSIDMYYDYGNNPATKVHFAHPTYGQLFRHSYPQDSLTHTYQVVMDAYSGASCINRSTQSITVLGVPTITFPAIASVCVNANPFQLKITQHGPTGNPGAVFTGTGVSSSGIFDPAMAGVGTQVIKCIYTSANGCADTLSQTITVEPVATVSAGPDVTVLAGGHITLKATASGSNLTYLWSPATGLNRTDVLQPIASPSANTKYTLTVISTTQNVPCAVTSSVIVSVLQAPTIPSGFTPNADGVNDTWVIQNLDTYPGATVDVFNRNGEKVFSSVGYSTPWDGRYNGVNLPMGTYYYVIDPKNGRSKITGYVAIVR